MHWQQGEVLTGVATGLLCFFKGIFNWPYPVYLGSAGRGSLIQIFLSFDMNWRFEFFFPQRLCFWWAVPVAFWVMMMLVQSVISLILCENSVTFSSVG